MCSFNYIDGKQALQNNLPIPVNSMNQKSKEAGFPFLNSRSHGWLV